MAQLIRRGKVWYSDFRATVNGKQKRYQRALSMDKREAQRLLGELLSERDKLDQPKNNGEWATFKRKYIDFYSTKSPITLNAHKRAISFLEKNFKVSNVSDVTPKTLDEALTIMTKEGRGLYIKVKFLKCLKAMMRRAESWGECSPQPWDMVKLPRMPRGRLKFFSTEQLKDLISESSGQWRTMIYLGALAGLRRSEMHWLEWANVDFARNRIHIHPKEGWNPKDYERRWVPMCKILREYLEKIKKEGGWVIGDENGERNTVGTMTNYFLRIARRSGVVGSLHTLRHTFGSHLAIAGVRLETIRDLMGHDSIKTTEIYAHLLPEQYEEAVDRLHPLLHPLDAF